MIVTISYLQSCTWMCLRSKLCTDTKVVSYIVHIRICTYICAARRVCRRGSAVAFLGVRRTRDGGEVEAAQE